MRLLVVEDEHKIANVIKEGLVEESFAVDICYDGEDGLLTAQSTDYDLIILDRMLPGSIDGVAFCKTLRAGNNHTPILMLTAKTQVHDRVTGLNSGADDYLAKPFSFEELLARVQALLRRPYATTNEVLSAANLTLNTTTKHVERAGTNIQLSAKEYAILEYLLRNKGKVVSKQSILNHVWDFDSDVLPSTVEVFIVYLRAKVDKPFAAPALIRTVRGFGYKIEEST
jgi:DNA-binding response OmpR family regulator